MYNWNNYATLKYNGNNVPHIQKQASGGAVDWATALQAGRSQFRFPMVSMKFFIDIIFRPHFGLWIYSTSNRNEYQEYFLGGEAVGA